MLKLNFIFILIVMTSGFFICFVLFTLLSAVKVFSKLWIEARTKQRIKCSAGDSEYKLIKGTFVVLNSPFGRLLLHGYLWV